MFGSLGVVGTWNRFGQYVGYVDVYCIRTTFYTLHADCKVIITCSCIGMFNPQCAMLRIDR
jgi:hypothetical protein